MVATLIYGARTGRCYMFAAHDLLQQIGGRVAWKCIVVTLLMLIRSSSSLGRATRAAHGGNRAVGVSAAVGWSDRRPLRQVLGSGQLPDPSLAPNYTTLNCSHYDVTYDQINADLAVHRKLGGISEESAMYAARKYGVPEMRGMTVGFYNGRAYLLTPTDWRGLMHHAHLHLSHMRMLLHVEATFGKAIPNTFFVLTTWDTPKHVSPLRINISSSAEVKKNFSQTHGKDFQPGPYPLLNYAKSDYWSDVVLVPCYHFHMKLYDNNSLGSIPLYNSIPWDQRKEALFGRFSHYKLHRNPADTSTAKLGRNGRPFCIDDSKRVTCPLRNLFIEKIVRMDRKRLQVSFAARVSFLKHAEFKYLAHLDGQGLSSRLEQLLPLGSLVFKQKSGYYAYYYKTLIKDGENVIEFWDKAPEEVLDKLDWAQKHDDQARRIGARGQEMAASYLNANGRTCYWYRALHALAGSASYSLKLSDWPQAEPLTSVVKKLQTTAWGRRLYALPFAI